MREPADSSAREIMKTGSKSFSFAALLFDAETRRAAEWLYRWCRYCDDRVDTAATSDEAREAAADLKSRLFNFATDAEFAAWERVRRHYEIPVQYALDLLDGMEMDANFKPPGTFLELEMYCYRVAGSVGVMMAHVMGVNDAKALDHAVDLGIAMQLTNIARDVKEDFENGRVYLPSEWLRESEVDASRLLDPAEREKTFGVIQRLLAEADARYRFAYDGLAHLNWRCALTIAAAAEIYSAIGHEILKKGPSALDQRMVIPLWKKIWRLSKALLRTFKLAGRRRRWKRVPLENPWRWTP